VNFSLIINNDLPTVLPLIHFMHTLHDILPFVHGRYITEADQVTTRNLYNRDLFDTFTSIFTCYCGGKLCFINPGALL
jgi:hypothetical protein